MFCGSHLLCRVLRFLASVCAGSGVYDVLLLLVPNMLMSALVSVSKSPLMHHDVNIAVKFHSFLIRQFHVVVYI